MPKLIGIATHAHPKGVMISHHSIHVSLHSGLDNDYRGASHPLYQVTVLSAQTWQRICHSLGTTLRWTERRANLLIDHLDFSQEKALIGKHIQIGNLLLEITAETDPCSRMDLIYPGLQKALAANWSGGVRCKVIQAGTIQLGNPVSLR